MSSKESLESILGELGKAINQRASQIKPMMEEIEKYNSDFDKKMESCKSVLYDIYKGIFESVGNVFSKFIGLPYIDDFKGKAKYRNIKEKGKEGKTIEKKVIKEIVFETGYKTGYIGLPETPLSDLIYYPFKELGIAWVDNDFVISSKKNYFKGRCGRKRSFDWFFNKKICKFFDKQCHGKYLNVEYLIRPIEELSYDINVEFEYGFSAKLIEYLIDFKDSKEYKRLEKEREENRNKLEVLDGIMNKVADNLNKFESKITNFENTLSKKNSKES